MSTKYLNIFFLKINIIVFFISLETLLLASSPFSIFSLFPLGLQALNSHHIHKEILWGR